MKTLKTTALFEHETISELVEILAMNVLEPWRQDELIEPIHGALLYRSATHPDVSALLQLATISLQALALTGARTDSEELMQAAYLIKEIEAEVARKRSAQD